MNQEKIETILLELGYNLTDRGQYWQTNAVYRDGDNRTAIQIWKDTGVWKDFVKNTKYSPIEKLIELSSNGNQPRILELLNSLKKEIDSDFSPQPIEKMEIDQFFDHDEIKTLLPHYSFYNKKGITNHTLELYQSGLSMSGKMNGRFVFPIYDQNRKVIGVSGRHLFWKSDSNFPKWKHIGRKANWIYPIYLSSNYEFPFQEAVENRKEIILVEGIGDSLALTEQNYLNHLVVFGLEISSKQMAYLSSLSLDKIIISTNNDKTKDSNRGLEAAIKIYLKLIDSFDISKIEIRLPILKDFGEMLENNISMDEWQNKKINKVAQIEYIKKYLYNNKCANSKNKIMLLKNYIEQLNAERDAIS